ncbi:MAG: ABC transporter ATP-binding protein [Bacteroidia bacterium]
MKVSINNISKNYQNSKALDLVSLTVPSGSIYGLLGPNGAGKTSLIRILTQITKQDDGEIFFDDELLSPHHTKLIGYLPEERGLYKKMTVGEQLLFFGQIKGLGLVEAKKELKKWGEKLEIMSWLPKKTEELSKGMQQKVQFIATVINNPKLLILDEPFSGFDPINAQIIINEIKELNKNGTTIIFSTHRMESVELLCNYIGLINKSKVVLDGAVNEIKNHYKLNQYKICFLNENLAENEFYDIISFSKHEKTAVIKPKTLMSNKDLIGCLLNQDVELTNFEEMVPAIEEIFIHAVKNLSTQLN